VKGRDTDRIQLALPVLDIATDAARAVHEHRSRKAACALRDAQRAGQRDLLALVVARQELAVADGERGEGVEFDARRHVLGRDGLRVGRAADQEAATTAPIIRRWIMRSSVLVARCGAPAALPWL
jgi:hypothetical protein